MTLFELIAVVVHHRPRQRDGGHALRLRRRWPMSAPRFCPPRWRSIARRPAGGRSPRATITCFASRSSAATRRSTRVYRRQGASTTLVDDVHAVPADVTVTTGGATDVEFTFTGEAWPRTRSRSGPRPHVDRHRAAGDRQGVRAISRLRSAYAHCNRAQSAISRAAVSLIATRRKLPFLGSLRCELCARRKSYALSCVFTLGGRRAMPTASHCDVRIRCSKS